MLFSVIIVTWNSEKYVQNCLNSILKNINSSFELIVIDNNSTDKTSEYVDEISATNPSRIHFIKNIKNLGFARAVNSGIKISMGEYIVLLNPDTIILENTFSEILNFFQKYPACSIMGGMHLNPDITLQSSVRSFPSLASQILILLKVHRIFPNLHSLKLYFRKNFDYQTAQKVEQIAGSFFVIKRNALEEIGWFDEGFPIWFEDVDYCARAQKLHHIAYYNPFSKIIHFDGASFAQADTFSKQKIFGKSLLRYFYKHKTKTQWLVLLFIYVFSLAESAVIAIVQKSFKKQNKKMDV